MNTNNGVERKNRGFKFEYLKQFKDKSLSGMLTVLIDQFLPEKYNRYNTKSFFIHSEFAEHIRWSFT